MAKTNRKTLKEYFGRGKKPDSTQFADLIDSMLNIVDDGFSKSPEKGLLLSPLDDDGAVMEIRRNILGDEPSWVVALGKEEELHIYRGATEQPVLTLHKDGRMQLGTEDRTVRLEVNGSIHAHAFTGTLLQGTVPADGYWHSISEPSYECCSYRVTAACGLKHKGKYGVAHVVAMHCFGKHRRIRCRDSWFGTRFNRLQFRWLRREDTCCLQVRTRSNYGADVYIHYRISSLLDMDFISE